MVIASRSLHIASILERLEQGRLQAARCHHLHPMVESKGLERLG